MAALNALPPGSLIGILGGGQLGRMMAMAAARLGFRTRIYCDRFDAPSFDVASEHIEARFDDEAALERFAKGLAVVTYEFENIPLGALEAVARHVPVRPGLKALAVAQDRLAEKRFLEELAIPAARYIPIDRAADLETAATSLGFPAYLKARRFGYDGKGQARLDSKGALAAAWNEIGAVPAILEEAIDFACEVSLIACRGRDGAFAAYDLVENHHEKQILRQSRVPARVPPEVGDAAHAIVEKIMVALDYVGTIAVEFFYLGAGDRPALAGRQGDARSHARAPLIVNEIAPRVHNSGHWTLDACLVDQFENHIRAIAGWPLGATWRHSDAVMRNLIGDEVAGWRDLAGDGALALHLYGKRESRPGRKMGHVTRLLGGSSDSDAPPGGEAAD